MSLCVRLLWGDKPPVVATDANAPRRPCAGSLSPLGDDTGVLSQARRGSAKSAKYRNILFLAHTQHIKQDYLTINDNK